MKQKGNKAASSFTNRLTPPTYCFITGASLTETLNNFNVLTKARCLVVFFKYHELVKQYSLDMNCFQSHCLSILVWKLVLYFSCIVFTDMGTPTQTSDI